MKISQNFFLYLQYNPCSILRSQGKGTNKILITQETQLNCGCASFIRLSFIRNQISFSYDVKTGPKGNFLRWFLADIAVAWSISGWSGFKELFLLFRHQDNIRVPVKPIFFNVIMQDKTVSGLHRSTVFAIFRRCQGNTSLQD